MHFLLTSRDQQGWQYGMLRCLEDEIVKQTGAERLEFTFTAIERYRNRRLLHGTRAGKLRFLTPTRRLLLPTDTEALWLVLMGAEGYRYDNLTGLDKEAPFRIAYHFDTLPCQKRVIRSLFSGLEWNVRITSFDDAVPMLEKETGHHWLHVDQATTLSYFESPPIEKRVIAFSSYGRRHPTVHEALIQFCASRRLYYDYTTHGLNDPAAPPKELFRQFAWHLSHSLFTVCWSVEMTDPTRAGGLSPITCRWFEAAAAGAVVIGQAPANPRFSTLFGSDFVQALDPCQNIAEIVRRLEEIWEQRADLLAQAAARRERIGENLDWSARVKSMIELASRV